MACSVITGADKDHQRLLPLWWASYRLHNNYPVTFVDFGMDEEGIAWCLERGKLLSLHTPVTAPPYSLLLKKAFGSIPNEVRSIWFKKPLACLNAPTATSIWIDADCIIRSALKPLFAYCENPLGFAIALEPKNVLKRLRSLKILEEKELLYNSGVVVFKKSSPLLPLWLSACEQRDKSFRGDQEALSWVLYKNKLKPKTLPSLWNSLPPWSPKAHIVHFAGGEAKKALLKISSTLDCQRL